MCNALLFVSIGGRAITGLCFADNIDGLAGEEEELAKLVERRDKASTAYSLTPPIKVELIHL